MSLPSQRSLWPVRVHLIESDQPVKCGASVGTIDRKRARTEIRLVWPPEASAPRTALFVHDSKFSASKSSPLAESLFEYGFGDQSGFAH
jgi:hypothetical protein